MKRLAVVLCLAGCSPPADPCLDLEKQTDASAMEQCADAALTGPQPYSPPRQRDEFKPGANVMRERIEVEKGHAVAADAFGQCYSKYQYDTDLERIDQCMRDVAASLGVE